jgi:aminoglycoside 6'-N-acetyltransferase I
MIVTLTKENERAWAELCIELWPELTIDEVLRLSHEGLFKNEFMYIEDNKHAAFLSLSLRSDYVEGTNSRLTGYIDGLYVRPEFRRRGIAEKMVAHAKKWSEEFGCTELASDCTIDNEASQAFHKHLGFTETGRKVCYIVSL